MAGRIVVVGLGPAGPDLVTAGTPAAIDAIPVRYLRTTRHPAASVVPGGHVVRRRVRGRRHLRRGLPAHRRRLLAAAAEHGEVLYAVPGSPRVLERTVDLLVAARPSRVRVEVEVLPALSFLDLAWVRLGVDPLEDGVRLVDAHRFAAGRPASGARCWWPTATTGGCCRTSSWRWTSRRRRRSPCCSAWACPTRRSSQVGWADLDRERRARPPHLPVHPRAGRAGGRRGAAVRGAGGHAAGAVPVGPRADPPHPHPPPARGDLRGGRGHRRPCPTGADGDRSGLRPRWRRSWATCCSRWCSTPGSAAEGARSRWPTWPAASTTSSSRRHPHVFAGASLTTSTTISRRWEEIKKDEKGREQRRWTASRPPCRPALRRQGPAARRQSARPAVDARPAGAPDRGPGRSAAGPGGRGPRRGGVDPEAALRAAARSAPRPSARAADGRPTPGGGSGERIAG